MPTQFGRFENDWLMYTETPVAMEWFLSGEAENAIIYGSWSPYDLVTGFQAAVARMPLGNNPVVALSGGVDSQAACLALINNSVHFRAAIMVMEDGLNSHDVDHALAFCEKYHIPFSLHPVNAQQFLWNDLTEYVHRYMVPSPQFALHFKFFEDVMKQVGPSTIICGGNAPNRRDDDWEFPSTRAQTAWQRFAVVNKQHMIGNFLAWSLDIALPLMLFRAKSKGYLSKVAAYHKCGLDVTPQADKFTGFEKLKPIFAELQGDGWAFEKLFRHPHQRIYPDYPAVFNLSNPVVQKLNAANDRFNTEANA